MATHAASGAEATVPDGGARAPVRLGTPKSFRLGNAPSTTPQPQRTTPLGRPPTPPRAVSARNFPPPQRGTRRGPSPPPNIPKGLRTASPLSRQNTPVPVSPNRGQRKPSAPSIPQSFRREGSITRTPPSSRPNTPRSISPQADLPPVVDLEDVPMQEVVSQDSFNPPASPNPELAKKAAIAARAASRLLKAGKLKVATEATGADGEPTAETTEANLNASRDFVPATPPNRSGQVSQDVTPVASAPQSPVATSGSAAKPKLVVPRIPKTKPDGSSSNLKESQSRQSTPERADSASPLGDSVVSASDRAGSNDISPRSPVDTPPVVDGARERRAVDVVRPVTPFRSPERSGGGLREAPRIEELENHVRALQEKVANSQHRCQYLSRELLTAKSNQVAVLNEVDRQAAMGKYFDSSVSELTRKLDDSKRTLESERQHTHRFTQALRENAQYFQLMVASKAVAADDASSVRKAIDDVETLTRERETSGKHARKNLIHQGDYHEALLQNEQETDADTRRRIATIESDADRDIGSIVEEAMKERQQILRGLNTAANGPIRLGITPAAAAPQRSAREHQQHLEEEIERLRRERATLQQISRQTQEGVRRAQLQHTHTAEQLARQTEDERQERQYLTREVNELGARVDAAALELRKTVSKR